MKGLDKWSLKSFLALYFYYINKESKSQAVFFYSKQGIKYYIQQILIKRLPHAGPLLGMKNTTLDKTSTFLALVELMVWSLNKHKKI